MENVSGGENPLSVQSVANVKRMASRGRGRQPVRWIECGVATAWLRIVDGVILWHGAEDETFDDFVQAQTKPAKSGPKLRSLFGDDDD